MSDESGGGKSVRGSCHCRAVVYVLADAPSTGMACNCSICRRKGSVLAFFPRSKFALQTPRDALATYTFNKQAIQHHFCKTCGCAPFAEGTTPDGREMVAINLRCIEDFDLASVKITEFDGASLN
jgi:hypothetical protein